MSNIYIFGITSAAGGIENLMHYFIHRFTGDRIFKEITIVTSFKSIAFEDEYLSNGIKVLKIPPRTNKSYKKSIKSIVSKIDSDDLLYINLSSYCNWKLLSTVKKANCKIIVHGHNAHVSNPIKKFLHFFGKHLFKNIGFKIAVSEGCGKFMYCNKNFDIIDNGIDFELFKFDYKNRVAVRKELGVEDSNPLIACVGRISAEKNQIQLLKFAKKHLDFIFVFIGDFMNEKYKRVILKNANRNCIFIGYKNDVGKYLSGMDAIFIPSKYESFPLAAAESLSNGLPLICFDYLYKQLPIAISSNPNCFKASNELLFSVITESNRSRNAGEIYFGPNYDIDVCIDKVIVFIKEKIYGKY